MESATAPAAGWFPDPGGSTNERWWSGDAWTEHTRQPLGDAVPAAFAAHLGTLVEERVAPPAEAPAEERIPEFAFAMTPTDSAGEGGALRTSSDELAHPGRHVAPVDAAAADATLARADAVLVAADAGAASADAVAASADAPAPGPSRPPVPAALLERASAAPVMTVPVPEAEPSVALPTPPAPAPVATIAAAAASSIPGFTVPAPAASPAAAAPSAVHESAAAESAPAAAAAAALAALTGTAAPVLPAVPAAPVPAEPAPAPAGPAAALAALTASAAPLLPAAAPSAPPEPAASASTASAAPALPTPAAPAAASAEPWFTMPGFAAPVAPTPAVAEAEGFVMPNLAAPLVMADEAPARPGRHADAPASMPEAPKLEAAPASAPVGFTSSADPTVANRYRQAIHAPEQPAEPDPLGASLAAPLAPPLGGSPAQPGWAGMPLPGAVPAPYATPAGYTAPGYAAPGALAPSPGLAPTPDYAASSYAAPACAAPTYAAPTGSNKAAKLALSTGISSLAALVFIIFGRILIVPSILSLVAIVTGIIGLVLARRAGVGKWSALGGLLMGIATSVTLTVSLVVTVVGAFALDTSIVEDDIVTKAASEHGIDIVSATCPDDVSVLTTTTFTCTAFDSSGAAYGVDVEVTDDGYMLWELQL